MKDKIPFVTELFIPMIETVASILSTDPNLTMVSPIAQVYLTPIKMVLLSMSELEKQRIKLLLESLSRDIQELKF